MQNFGIHSFFKFFLNIRALIDIPTNNIQQNAQIFQYTLLCLKHYVSKMLRTQCFKYVAVIMFSGCNYNATYPHLKLHKKSYSRVVLAAIKKEY